MYFRFLLLLSVLCGVVLGETSCNYTTSISCRNDLQCYWCSHTNSYSGSNIGECRALNPCKPGELNFGCEYVEFDFNLEAEVMKGCPLMFWSSVVVIILGFLTFIFLAGLAAAKPLSKRGALGCIMIIHFILYCVYFVLIKYYVMIPGAIIGFLELISIIPVSIAVYRSDMKKKSGSLLENVPKETPGNETVSEETTPGDDIPLVSVV